MAEAPLLSTDEIVRRLRTITATDYRARYGRHTPGMATISRQANVSNGYLYEIALGISVPAAKTRRKLSNAFKFLGID